MPTYQKAFLLEQLRTFPGWSEAGIEAESEDPEAAGLRPTRPGPELTDRSIVYLREDLRVYDDCFDSGRVIFDRVTPEWEAFCKNVLQFRTPDWDEESRMVREAISRPVPGTSPPGGTRTE